MRISYWSSDVCSSDLGRPASCRGADAAPRSRDERLADRTQRLQRSRRRAAEGIWLDFRNRVVEIEALRAGRGCWRRRVRAARGSVSDPAGRRPQGRLKEPRHGQSCRSEEHTSELQSLMRISYAVFCLKKKNTRQSKNI